ncbi:MAG: hypothetical protein ACPIOQ_16105, partial [Promethearchaeia archaeon]
SLTLFLTRVPAGSARLLNDGGACSACWVRGPGGACVHTCTATICCDLPLSQRDAVRALAPVRVPGPSWLCAASARHPRAGLGGGEDGGWRLVPGLDGTRH